MIESLKSSYCVCDYPSIPNICSRAALIIQNPRWAGIFDFSLVARISIVDLSAVGFVICKTEARVRSLLSRLSKSQSDLQQNPLALLNVLCEEYGRNCETARKWADDEVVLIESSTGMSSIRVQAPNEAERDIAELNKASHAANTNLIVLDNLINFDVVLGKFVKEIFVKLEIMRQRRKIEPIPIAVSQVLHDNIDFMIVLSALRRQQAQSLHQRVQSQISVVSNTNQANQALLPSTWLVWAEIHRSYTT